MNKYYDLERLIIRLENEVNKLGGKVSVSDFVLGGNIEIDITGIPKTKYGTLTYEIDYLKESIHYEVNEINKHHYLVKKARVGKKQIGDTLVIERVGTRIDSDLPCRFKTCFIDGNNDIIFLDVGNAPAYNQIAVDFVIRVNDYTSHKRSYSKKYRHIQKQHSDPDAIYLDYNQASFIDFINREFNVNVSKLVISDTYRAQSKDFYNIVENSKKTVKEVKKTERVEQLSLF